VFQQPEICIFSPIFSPIEAVTAEINVHLQESPLLTPAPVEKLYFCSIGKRSRYPPMTVSSFG
ncbi:hypothetical protein, partial [Paenibacillus thiaminolyticus]